MLKIKKIVGILWWGKVLQTYLFCIKRKCSTFIVMIKYYLELVMRHYLRVFSMYQASPFTRRLLTYTLNRVLLLTIDTWLEKTDINLVVIHLWIPYQLMVGCQTAILIWIIVDQVPVFLTYNSCELGGFVLEDKRLCNDVCLYQQGLAFLIWMTFSWE